MSPRQVFVTAGRSISHRDPSAGLRRNRYWTQEELDTLQRLAMQGVSTKKIASQLRRTPLAIRLKASRLRIPLTEWGDRRSDPQTGARPRRLDRRDLTRNFDVTQLTGEERERLFRNLLAETPRLLQIALDIAAGSDPLHPTAYDASAAATERNAARVEEWRKNRKKLGWKTEFDEPKPRHRAP